MLSPGLVSITFRQLSPEAIISLCQETRLESIEWGGDVHVPHGDLATAQRVGEATRKAGLRVAAYGSYYRAVEPDDVQPAFGDVLASAKALGAPMIRVWAGLKDWEDASEDERQQTIETLQKDAEAAQVEGVRIVLEFHGGTLTNSTQSTLDTLAAINHPNLRSLWQPIHGEPVDSLERSLEAVLPWLENVHVFHWFPTSEERHPLADGWARWESLLRRLRSVGSQRDLLLEFVRGDDPDQLREDAATLHEWLRRIQD